MFSEYYPSVAGLNAMVNAVMGTTLTGTTQSIGATQTFSLPTGSQYDNDPILNGAFGDVRGQKWGADGYELHGFTGLPSNDVVVYSTRTDGAACMFRHKTKPFLFNGDGGFLSNYQRYIGGTYQGSSVYYPFAIDANYKPIPRTNYAGSSAPIYNSTLFANILEWAVDYSENNGITYPETGNKFPL